MRIRRGIVENDNIRVCLYIPIDKVHGARSLSAFMEYVLYTDFSRQ